MNENTTGAPLTATVGEQLGEKAHQGEVHEQERHAGDAVETRVERKKTEERSAASEHAGMAPPAAPRKKERTRPARGRAAAAAEQAAGGEESPARGAQEGAGTHGRPERRVPGQRVDRGGHSWVPLAAAAIAWVVAQSLARRIARRLVRGRKSLLRRWR